MPTAPTDCRTRQSSKIASPERPKPLGFGRLKGKVVEADFSGGAITSDAGLLLVQQVDRQFGITEKFARCFEDRRTAHRVEHSVEQMVAQRTYALVQGYEDLTDHEQLRHDPMFGIAVGKLESQHARCAPLAGKSTLNRLELGPPREGAKNGKDRYVKVVADLKAMEQVFVELFFALTEKPPCQLILDFDVTDDPTHGQQELSAFNGYYRCDCYAPLYIFCGHHLLGAKLRASDVDPAAGALEELQRLVPLLRQRWPKVEIIVRGDSAYSRDEIMSWCEDNEVDYIFGYASNARLRRMTHRLELKAQQNYEYYQRVDPSYEPAPLYRTVYYRTLDSWQHHRRLVCQLRYDDHGVHRRFVVTSIPAAKVCPKYLYQNWYCPRGEMENRLKEQQLGLFSDRTSSHGFASNQLRLYFSSLAYVLMQAMRQSLLAKTDFAKAQVWTIRNRLLKLGAQVRISMRRIHVAICSHCPVQALLTLVHQRLQLAETG